MRKGSVEMFTAFVCVARIHSRDIAALNASEVKRDILNEIETTSAIDHSPKVVLKLRT